MVAKLVCSNCGAAYSADGLLPGAKFSCAKCQEAVSVPVPGPKDAGALIGRTVKGCWLERRLGGGGWGEVYLAQQAALGRRVAVKLMSARQAKLAYVKRFRREAQTAAALDHPNIVRIIDYGEEDSFLILIMEYVSGTTVTSLVKQEGPMQGVHALQVALPIARALEHAHEHNVVHRDVTPGNIIIAEDGTPKLADFGLAKDVTTAGQSRVTRMGVALGTPAYVSPEQIRNARMAGAASDVYSLGASMYFMLSGKPPFEGSTPGETMAAVLQAPPRDLCQLAPNIPPSLGRLVARAMARDLAERLGSAGELAAEVERILKAASKKPVGRRLRRGKRVRRLRRR